MTPQYATKDLHISTLMDVYDTLGMNPSIYGSILLYNHSGFSYVKPHSGVTSCSDSSASMSRIAPTT